MDNWRILVVDDEPDVHLVTNLALKKRKWRNRGFSITSAHSAKEAMELLESESFNVALVDVVMESDQAGLDLCHYIREHCDRSLRIILRTGQPGVAPEEKVLNDYDIDHYVAKVEATHERLFTLVRAGLRASQDIETLLMIGKQMEKFAVCLQSTSSTDDLEAVMRESLEFLEARFNVRLLFFADLEQPVEELESLRAALLRAHEQEVSGFVGGDEIGIEPNQLVMPIRIEVRGDAEKNDLVSSLRRKWRTFFGEPPPAAVLKAIRSGIAAEFGEEPATAQRTELTGNLTLLMHNWRIAYSALCLQEEVAYQRVVGEFRRREQMDGPLGPEA